MARHVATGRPISSPAQPVRSIGKGSYVQCRNVTGRGGQSMAACASDPRCSRASSMHTDRPGPDRIRANLPGNSRTRSHARLPMPVRSALGRAATCSMPCRWRKIEITIACHGAERTVLGWQGISPPACRSCMTDTLRSEDLSSRRKSFNLLRSGASSSGCRRPVLSASKYLYDCGGPTVYKNQGYESRPDNSAAAACTQIRN